MKPKKRAKNGTLKMLGVLVVLALLLAGVHRFSQAREVALAIGPANQEQEQFFVEAADRPDIVQFFGALEPSKRLQMAKNLGAHSNPKVANLIGLLLPTFDADARAALTESLRLLAQKQPEAVSKELKHSGSFQRLAVFAALRSLGDSAVPVVASRLKEPETRSNAVVYLVEERERSVPTLMTVLRGDDKDSRVAAADALAKIGATEAVPDLLRLYEAGVADEKPAYLVALATIGDARAEKPLVSSFGEESLPPHLRAQAALGLGRVASPTALDLLWKAAQEHSPSLRQAAVSGLQLAGDKALDSAPQDPKLLNEVLAGVPTSRSTKRLLAHLQSSDRAVRTAALEALSGRDEAIQPLHSYLLSLDISEDGAEIDAAIGALSGSAKGLQVLRGLRSSQVGAAVDRRLALIGHDA